MEPIEVDQIVKELYEGILPVFPNEEMDVILFGSFARGDYEDGSDIDIMILVNEARETIAEKNWLIGNIAGDLLVEHGILVSPIIENRDWFINNSSVVPLYRNIMKEGILMNV